jgi:inorganic pyrophosphatase
MNKEFWEYLQHLVDSSRIMIDRPKGSIHPRYPQRPYPVSYGYLEGTKAMDSGGVDIWVGSLKDNMVVGALCTVDLQKRDTELKIMYDCSDEEINAILRFVNHDQMRAELLKKTL